MSALAEALLAAQRQAIAALSKAYVGGALDAESLTGNLSAVGATDVIDQAALLASLDVIRTYGAQAPAPATNAKPDASQDPATEAQWKLIRKLADDRGTVAPDYPLTKETASNVIERLKDGTYTPAPF